MTDRAAPDSKKSGTEASDFQWLLAELDRLWFHDNALSFQVGDWFRSSCFWSWDQCWKSPDFLSKTRKRPWNRCPPPLQIQSQGPQLVEMEAVNRPVREIGKTFSTGDLALLHSEIDIEEDRSVSPGCVSDGGIGMAVLDEETEFVSKKLQTIPSASALIAPDNPIFPEGKQSSTVAATSTTTGATATSRRRRRSSSSHHRSNRSWSGQEFDELRGLRDLGFKPSKEDLLTPHRVVSLATTKPVSSSTDRRIYPSHAWNIRRPDSPLLNLRMPDPNRQGVEDMKAHLKFWARAVASTVRQEC